MDAAFAVIARTGYVDAPVGEVIAEAGVSTRSFYPHFATKDALLLALFRRDAEVVARRLGEAVDAVADPADALGAWVDGFLDLFYESRRARRVALFTAPAVRRADGYDDELAASRVLLAAPLARVIRRGVDADVFESDAPDLDAEAIVAIAADAARPVSNRPPLDRDGTRALVMRFAEPALAVRSRSSGRAGRRSRRT